MYINDDQRRPMPFHTSVTMAAVIVTVPSALVDNDCVLIENPPQPESWSRRLFEWKKPTPKKRTIIDLTEDDDDTDKPEPEPKRVRVIPHCVECLATINDYAVEYFESHCHQCFMEKDENDAHFKSLYGL